jgi:hypothetical protein
MQAQRTSFARNAHHTLRFVRSAEVHLQVVEQMQRLHPILLLKRSVLQTKGYYSNAHFNCKPSGALSSR